MHHHPATHAAQSSHTSAPTISLISITANNKLVVTTPCHRARSTSRRPSQRAHSTSTRSPPSAGSHPRTQPRVITVAPHNSQQPQTTKCFSLRVPRMMCVLSSLPLTRTATTRHARARQQRERSNSTRHAFPDGGLKPVAHWTETSKQTYR